MPTYCGDLGWRRCPRTKKYTCSVLGSSLSQPAAGSQQPIFSTMPIFFRCCKEPCSMARHTVWTSRTAVSWHLKHEHDIDSDDGFFEWYAAELHLLEPSDLSNNIWRVPTDVLLSELKKRPRPQPPNSPPPTKRAKTAAKDRPIGQGRSPSRKSKGKSIGNRLCLSISESLASQERLPHS